MKPVLGEVVYSARGEIRLRFSLNDSGRAFWTPGPRAWGSLRWDSDFQQGMKPLAERSGGTSCSNVER